MSKMIQIVGLCVAIACLILLAVSVGDNLKHLSSVSDGGTLTSTVVETSTTASSVAE